MYVYARLQVMSDKGDNVDENEGDETDEERNDDINNDDDLNVNDEEENLINLLNDEKSEDHGNRTYTLEEKDEDPLFSQEEFPSYVLHVGRTVISNYTNVKDTIKDYSKIPDDIFEKDSKFSANPTSLNNRLVFIAPSPSRQWCQILWAYTCLSYYVGEGTQNHTSIHIRWWFTS